MIVAQGRGGIVAGIVFGSCLLTELLLRAGRYGDNYYQQHGWPKLASFLFSAMVVWLITGDNYPDTSAPFEPSFRRWKLLRGTDHLFFIPARYWPALLCALGVVFYFVRER